jgi:hypothetical protein
MCDLIGRPCPDRENCDVTMMSTAALAQEAAELVACLVFTGMAEKPAPPPKPPRPLPVPDWERDREKAAVHDTRGVHDPDGPCCHRDSMHCCDW